MRLYHGTNKSSAMNICNNGIILTKGKSTADFGQGFYATESKTLYTNCTSRKSYKDTKAIVLLEFDIDAATSCIKEFKDASVEWGSFVIANRNPISYSTALGIDNNLKAQYDIVKGPVADKNVLDTAKLLGRQCKYLDESVLDEIVDKQYLDQIQYSFHTEKALSFLRIIDWEVLK